jgi:SulP family sulfate permease
MRFPLQLKIPKPAEAVQTVVQYGRKDLRHDAIAGLTVAVMGVPQAMAYALIAGLPPVYGLYTSIATCIVAALMGSSNHLVTGPTMPSAWSSSASLRTCRPVRDFPD